jgi:hypothetical protein
LKTTIASHSAPPFLVAPNDRMSMPATHIGRAAPEARQRVGEAGAVHVHPEPPRLRDAGDRGDLGERVDGAEIAGLRDVDGGRLAAMQLARLDRRQHAGQRLGADAAVLAGDRHELEAAAEKAGRICLRCIDVRRLAAIDEPPAGADRGQ